MLSSDQLFREAIQKNNAYVAGIDISLTSTGVYLMALKPSDYCIDFHYHITTKAQENSDSSRIDFIAAILMEDLSNPLYPVIAVCMEDYGPIGKFAGKITARAELVGIVKSFLRNVRRVPYFTVSPTGLKKFATGNGRTPKGSNSKTAMLTSAHRDGFITKNSDQIDAFYAARFCASVLQGDNPTSDYRRVNPEGFTF